MTWSRCSPRELRPACNVLMAGLARSEEDSNAWHDSDYHSDLAADRRSADVAVQHRLGLLSGRRIRPHSDHRHHSGCSRKTLSMRRCAGWMTPALTAPASATRLRSEL